MRHKPSLENAFGRIRAWTAEHAPDIQFNPPASPAQIKALANNIDPPLPDELRVYLQLANGETWRSGGVIGRWSLLEGKLIESKWSMMNKLVKDGVFGENEGTAETPVYIKNYWWNPAWIPIVSSGSGHLICLDTDPPESSRFGQVILFLHDSLERYLVAGSLPAWFDRIAQDLETGLYAYGPVEGYEDDTWNCEALMWSSLQGKHIYEDPPGRRIV